MSKWVSDEVRISYSKFIEESLIEVAQYVASDLSETVSDGAINIDRIDNVFKKYQRKPILAHVHGHTKESATLNFYVTDNKGFVLYHSDSPFEVGKDYSQWNDVHLTLQGQYGARSTRTDKSNALTSVFYVAAPVLVENELVGVITVFKPEQTVAAMLKSSSGQLLLGLAIYFLLSALVIFIVFKWIASPFDRLIEYVNRVRDGLRPDLPKLPKGEFRNLGTAIQEMKDTIEEKQQLETYVQNLTHELKSPLTAISAAAEICRDGAEPTTAKKFNDNILSESERIKKLLDRLLEISSLDRIEKFDVKQKVNFRETLETIKEDLAPALKAKKMNLMIQGDAEALGEPFLIYQALRNIIQNAIDHSGESSGIICTIKDKPSPHVTILDEGPGIPDFAMDKIFDRFFSLPPSGAQAKSSGLGLTFVKEVVALHHGEIRAENSEKGAKFTLSL